MFPVFEATDDILSNNSVMDSALFSVIELCFTLLSATICMAREICSDVDFDSSALADNSSEEAATCSDELLICFTI